MLILMLLFSVAALWSARLDAEAEIRSTLRLMFSLLPNRIALPYPGAGAGESLRLLDVSEQMKEVRHVRVSIHDALGKRISGHAAQDEEPEGGFGWPIGGGIRDAQSRAMRKDIYADGVKVGYFLLTPSTADELSEIQTDFARQITLTWVFAVAMVVVVYWAVARALAPVEAMRGALKEIESGNHAARLPQFELAEMKDLSMSFNHMAAALQSTTSERNATLLKLLEIEESTRRSIARDLHDELSPYLVAMRPNVLVLQRYFAENAADAPCRDCVSSIADHVGRLVFVVRDLLSNLHPAELDTLGLRAALRHLCDERERDSDRDIEVSLETRGEWKGFSPTLDTSIYRIVQECLTNSIKHSDCTAIHVTVSVLMTMRGGSVTVDVLDNGRSVSTQFPASGMGTLGMRERAIALGGRFESGHDAQGGWRVRAWLPLGVVRTDGQQS